VGAADIARGEVEDARERIHQWRLDRMREAGRIEPMRTK
jgi:hypothetical protein